MFTAPIFSISSAPIFELFNYIEWMIGKLLKLMGSEEIEAFLGVDFLFAIIGIGVIWIVSNMILIRPVTLPLVTASMQQQERQAKQIEKERLQLEREKEERKERNRLESVRKNEALRARNRR